jgi:malonyl-CoA/methylmalonyl-CoA synthetase
MSHNLYKIFYENFKSDLDKICIEIPDYKKMSFKDLDILSAHFASFLHDLGLKKGDRMICQIDKSLSAIGLYLGCLRKGVIYTPLNTSYTNDEVEYFINNIEPKLFVCRPESKSTIKDICSRLNVPSFVAIGKNDDDPVLSEILSTEPLNIFENCSDKDVAAILFTSGTTGKSKGAMITHGNLSSNAIALREIWGFTSEDILLHALPIFHVHGLFVALNTALLSASKIILLEKFNIKDVIKNLTKSSVMMGVPTYYNRLVNEEAFKYDSYSGVRLFISGSAPLTEKTFKEFKEKTNHSILERYGMTETGMITSNPLDGNRLEGTVGFPLPGVTIRAMKEGKILSDNEKGVIEVKGPNVFKGYWRMEEKTKEEFTEDGFFITGDIGQIDENGRLTLSGRSSDMIISGGYNVYPKEIEIILNTIKGIKESAIIGVKHSDLGESPIAILVPEREDFKISDDEIIEILKEKIAKYKIPKLFIWIDELPLNAMGKVQKKNLRVKYEKILL